MSRPARQPAPRPIPLQPRWALARLAGAFALLAAIASCTPEIGDKCQVSTDCSVRGDRLCDTSQPGGYCTQLNCRANSCADEAACILFNSALPGCGYDDRSGPFGSRVARSFCMAQCESNGDCREGYVCADPRTSPWNAAVLDHNPNKRACLPKPLDEAFSAVDRGQGVDPPVCRPVFHVDASIPSTEAGTGTEPLLVPDAGAPADAATDGG